MTEKLENTAVIWSWYDTARCDTSRVNNYWINNNDKLPKKLYIIGKIYYFKHARTNLVIVIYQTIIYNSDFMSLRFLFEVYKAYEISTSINRRRFESLIANNN